jgi:Leucine-rich repeat (LRR) protein
VSAGVKEKNSKPVAAKARLRLLYAIGSCWHQCALCFAMRRQLDGNELTSVPEEIGSLTNLQTLWLQDNQIASVPASLGHLTGLRQLLLSHNKLQTVPRELGALTLLHSLWLDGNPLVALPQSFSALTQLKRL